jgi:membrane-associated phospholipid phosphatase
MIDAGRCGVWRGLRASRLSMPVSIFTTSDLPWTVMIFGHAFRRWCFLFAATIIAVAVCIPFVDVPLALMVRGGSHRLSHLGNDLGSKVLVAGEVAVLAVLAIVRLVRGKLPPFFKAVFIACCASLSAFVANDYVFKVFFGRLNPPDFFAAPSIGIFHFFQGTYSSSFPSGHMVMATSFAAAMMRLEPWTRIVLMILLAIGAVLLVIGEWHFLSDVVAGTFVGGTAGFVAGELWAEHEHDRAR